MTGRGPVLTALAIIPDRELAAQSRLRSSAPVPFKSCLNSSPILRCRHLKSGCVRPSRT